MRRRAFLLGLAALAPFAALAGEVNVEEILGDPAAPVGGDPKGDVAIVAFQDYNCPFCKKTAPALDVSCRRGRPYASRLQGLADPDPGLAWTARSWRSPPNTRTNTRRAHAAMMALPGRSTPSRCAPRSPRPASTWPGSTPISPAMPPTSPRSSSATPTEADSLGLQGTPVFLIGPFKVAAAVDYDGFAAWSPTRARARGARSLRNSGVPCVQLATNRSIAMQIGFIGLGAMGRGMAKNLAAAGHQVKAWNRSGGEVEGVTLVGAPQEAFQAEAAVHHAVGRRRHPLRRARFRRAGEGRRRRSCMSLPPPSPSPSRANSTKRHRGSRRRLCRRARARPSRRRRRRPAQRARRRRARCGRQGAAAAGEGRRPRLGSRRRAGAGQRGQGRLQHDDHHGDRGDGGGGGADRAQRRAARANSSR